jgi:hypothetical protein
LRKAKAPPAKGVAQKKPAQSGLFYACEMLRCSLSARITSYYLKIRQLKDSGQHWLWVQCAEAVSYWELANIVGRHIKP